jgi:hypothetical protein
MIKNKEHLSETPDLLLGAEADSDLHNFSWLVALFCEEHFKKYEDKQHACFKI